jgi:hypothetical protein
MIGTPAGTIGTSSSAKRAAEMASNRVLLSVSLGQRSPRNAAGTTASRPHAAGSPIAPAPRAPRRVKRFQKK